MSQTKSILNDEEKIALSSYIEKTKILIEQRIANFLQNEPQSMQKVDPDYRYMANIKGAEFSQQNILNNFKLLLAAIKNGNVDEIYQAKKNLFYNCQNSVFWYDKTFQSSMIESTTATGFILGGALGIALIATAVLLLPHSVFLPLVTTIGVAKLLTSVIAITAFALPTLTGATIGAAIGFIYDKKHPPQGFFMASEINEKMTHYCGEEPKDDLSQKL